MTRVMFPDPWQAALALKVNPSDPQPGESASCVLGLSALTSDLTADPKPKNSRPRTTRSIDASFQTPGHARGARDEAKPRDRDRRRGRELAAQQAVRARKGRQGTAREAARICSGADRSRVAFSGGTGRVAATVAAGAARIAAFRHGCTSGA
jgi:hypothetical protein